MRPRVDLQLANEHLARPAAVEREIDEVAVAGAVPDLLEAASLDRQLLRLDVVAVEDGGHLTPAPHGVDVAPGL